MDPAVRSGRFSPLPYSVRASEELRGDGQQVREALPVVDHPR